MSKSELIKAIDAQDTRVIQAYLQAHQELDCNALTPNGLSALWVALNPPLGKPISRDVVRFLLNYVKNNGEPLINPTQEYNGYTASQYLESFKDYTIQQGYFANAGEYSNLFYLVRYTENNYIHPQRADQGAQNLGGLAADAQNVHDSFVSKLAKSNLARLYQHYVLEQDKKLDNAAISSCRGTLKIAIGRLKKDKTHQEKAVQMEQGLAFCKNNTSRFTLELESKQEVSMTLSEVLALLGHAIEEKDDSLLILPEKEKDNNPKEEARQARIQGVLGILYDNATAYYGLNRASCEGGAFNRFGFALAALHHLVKNQSDEPLTGEVARMEMSQFFKKLLETLIQENIPLYWKVVRAQLLNNPTDKEDTEAYEQFVSDHMNEWTKTLIEEHHIEEQEARNFTSVIEEAYPYHQHELTRNLLLLLPLISATKEGIKLLAQLKENYPAADALNGVLALCAGTLAQQPQWTVLLSLYDLEPSRDFALLFIKHYLAYCRQNGGQVTNFTALFHPVKPLSEEAQDLTKKILFLTALEQQKEALSTQYPEQKQWLLRLTQDEQHDLLATLADQHPNLSLKDLPFLMPEFIEIALQKGYLRHLSIKGMTFKDRDWRGFALDGVDLEGASFIRCDFRLATAAGANLKKTHLNDSILPFFNQKNKYSNKKLCDHFLKLARAGYSLSVLGVLQHPGDLGGMLFKHEGKYGYTALLWAATIERTETLKLLLAHKDCTGQVFNHENNNGDTALLVAARHGHTEVIKLLLKHQHCTKQLFNHEDKDGYTALLVAVRYGQKETLKLLLGHKHCTEQVFNHVGNDGYTALLWAAIHGQTEVVRLLLEHQHCTEQVLNHANDFGNTALLVAARHGQKEALKLLLKHQHCTEQAFNHENKDGDTALLLAAANGRTEALKLLLKHQHCTEQAFNHENKDGDTALLLAARHGNTETLELLLKNQHYTEQAFNHVNKNGNTALLLAAANGRTEALKLLLKHQHCTKQLFNHENKNGDTALLWTAANGRTAVLELLLEHQHCTEQAFNLESKNGNTPLLLAARNGRTEVLELLLEHQHCTKQLFNHENKNGDTALLWAAANGHTEVIKLLLEHQHYTKQAFNHENKDGNTALLAAAANGRTEVLELLLAHKDSTEQVFNHKNKSGETALLLAAANGEKRVMKPLLDHRWRSIQEVVFVLAKTHKCLQSLNPKPLLLETCMALLDYRDSFRSRVSSFFGTRHHRDFVMNLLREAKPLTPETLYLKVKKYAKTLRINPDGHFQKIVMMIDQFPEEFKFDAKQPQDDNEVAQAPSIN